VDGYEIRAPAPRDARGYSLHARRPLLLTEADSSAWKTYKPLEDYPDLFLKFARLARRPRSEERALAWCREYGVLGLAGDHHWGWTGENKALNAHETLTAFDAEVERAAGVLALYDAALNRDGEAAEHYVREKYPQVSAELDPGFRLGEDWDSSVIGELVNLYGKGDYLAYALEAAAFVVESTVRGSCYPILRSEGSRDPADVSGGWGFKNLRGAMYLQLYWLMAAGGNVVRCKFCGGVISLASSAPGARKPRDDKKYCDDVCRQRNHYRKRKAAQS
jgi:hypothetical protein